MSTPIAQPPASPVAEQLQEMKQPTAPAAETVREEAQERGAEGQKPVERAELMKQAEGLRRAIADAETKRTDAVERTQKDEADAAEKQERIRAVLGGNANILETVRQESLMLNQMYALVANDLGGELKAIEKKLEQPEAETAKDLMPDVTAETVVTLNKPAANDNSIAPAA